MADRAPESERVTGWCAGVGPTSPTVGAWPQRTLEACWEFAVSREGGGAGAAVVRVCHLAEAEFHRTISVIWQVRRPRSSAKIVPCLLTEPVGGGRRPDAGRRRPSISFTH